MYFEGGRRVVVRGNKRVDNGDSRDGYNKGQSLHYPDGAFP